MFTPEVIERYSREILVREIGIKGLYKLRKTRVLVVGCGATGTFQAELLARMGIGFIRIVDKDFVEPSNLPRTLLYSYKDSIDALPKAIACTNRLKEIDPQIKVEPVIARATSRNIIDLMKDADIVIDGTDNMITRFLINDASIKLGKPWVFVGVVSWYGNVLFINPGKGPCLRCFISTELLEREQRNACEVLGVVNTAVALASSISVSLVLKHILDLNPDYNSIYLIDSKNLEITKVKLKKRPACPACGLKQYDFLKEETREEVATPICGTKAVEITPKSRIRIDPLEVARLFDRDLVVAVNPYLLKIRVDKDIHLIVFSDGRAIVDGITDTVQALDIYRKYFLEKIREQRV